MSDWHVPSDVLTRFAREPESLDDVAAASVESHVIGCALCRVAIAAEAEAATMAASWNAIVDVVDRPRRSVMERVLGRLMAADTARLVTATPGLQFVWLVAVAALMAAAVAVSRSTGSVAPFLVAAPLVPLAGVGAAFRSDADPGGEAGAAAPMATGALLLRRAEAVVVTSVLVLGAGSLALPGIDPQAAAWLLPALFLTVGSLAASTWIDARRAVAGAACVWLGALLAASLVHRPAVSVTESVLFGGAGQAVFALCTVAAAAALVARRSRLACLEVL